MAKEMTKLDKHMEAILWLMRQVPYEQPKTYYWLKQKWTELAEEQYQAQRTKLKGLLE